SGKGRNAQLIEYFGMIFGISFEGAESLAVINSRNDYFSFNYLRSVFYKNRVSNLIAKRVDKDNLLLKDTAIPYKFLMLTSGYDRFFQRINEDKENVSVSLNQQIVDLDRSETADSGKYTLISSDGTTFDGFDQVVLAIPMKQIKKIKYDYIQQLTKSIGIGAPNFVLTSFCNLDTSYLTHLPKGIYLDDNNPYKVGMPDAKRDGSLYGLYKHFYADSMFQSLTMVNDIDPESIDESFIHDKWHQALKAFGFDVKPTDVKPYSWHVVKWECPFPRTHDFAHFEKLEAEQGKKGIWFGGEMLSGSGIPVILRYVESLFGPVV
ncbi:MAG: FAD-dependent oxidoreductase, partial [Bacteroidota bacterium]